MIPSGNIWKHLEFKGKNEFLGESRISPGFAGPDANGSGPDVKPGAVPVYTRLDPCRSAFRRSDRGRRSVVPSRRASSYMHINIAFVTNNFETHTVHGEPIVR